MATIVRVGRAAKQARVASLVRSSRPPILKCVYAAIYAGKIDEEEAKDLNPKFEPNKQYGKLKKYNYKETQGSCYRTIGNGVASLTPSCLEIHSAVQGGHITEEEGRDLNKTYKPEIPTNLIHYRKIVKAQYIKESGIGKTPSLINLHRAYLQGYITEEEAIELNSGYDLSIKYMRKALDTNLQKQDTGYWKAKRRGVVKNDR